MARVGQFLGVVLIAQGAFGTSHSQQVSLAVIPTEVQEPAPAPQSASLSVRVYARDLSERARKLMVTAPERNADSLVVTLGRYPQLASNAEHNWLASSFLIDHHESPVVDLVRAYRAQTTGAPSVESLVRFVNKAIAASGQRGWDVASRVAQLRVGDCTEHAVLLAAMARAVGMPARVQLGLALVYEAGRYQAFGHAWAEIERAGQWTIADAALAELSVPARYLPFGVLEDEGPGFTLAIAGLTNVWAQRIVVLSPHSVHSVSPDAQR